MKQPSRPQTLATSLSTLALELLLYVAAWLLISYLTSVHLYSGEFDTSGALFLAWGLFCFMLAQPGSGRWLPGITKPSQLSLLIQLIAAFALSLMLPPSSRPLLIAAVLLPGIWLHLGMHKFMARWMRTHRLVGRFAAFVFTLFILAESLLQVAAVLMPGMGSAAIGDAKADDLTILCLGDSFTWGIGASDRDHAWPALLQGKLNSAFPESKITVINSGFPGLNSSTVRKQLEQNIKENCPNMAIVACGYNNLWNLKDIDFSGMTNISPKQRWNAQAKQLFLRLRLFKILQLSHVTFKDSMERGASGSLSDEEKKTLTLCRLAFVPEASTWMGSDVFARFNQYLQAEAPPVVRRAWALGQALNDSPPTGLSADTQAELERMLNALKANRPQEAGEILWGKSGLGRKEDQILLQCHALKLAGQPKAAQEKIVQLWRIRQDPHSIISYWLGSPQEAAQRVQLWRHSQDEEVLALSAIGFIADASAIQADVMRHKSLYRCNQGEVAFLEKLATVFTDPLLHQRINETDPLGRIALYQKANNEKDHALALTTLQRMLQADPGWHWAWYKSGERLAQLARFEESLEAFNKALSLYPGDPDALAWKGLTLARLGREDEALATFDDALLAGLDYINFRPQLIAALGSQDKFRKHIESLRHARPEVYAKLPSSTDSFYSQKRYLHILSSDLDAMRRLCEESGTMFLLHNYPNTTEISFFLEEYGEKHGCLLASHLPSFDEKLKTMKREELFRPDGHPTDFGYSMMAQSLFEAINPIIKNTLTGGDR
jgi:tetratricopeptide (TPR) repeat protein